jgi:diadenosine tetraphosphatase ApaH/serine/threonine PP2A family protein phosphatase
MQFDRMVGHTRVVNAGSVGMSFEGVGAYWLLIERQIARRRTEYDVDAAARRIRQTAYPLAEAFAATHVLTTPDVQAMRRAFAAAELTAPMP